MAPPADPRAGRRSRRSVWPIALLVLVVGTAGLALAAASSAGWSWPGGGLAAIVRPEPTEAPSAVPSTPSGPTASAQPEPASPSPPVESAAPVVGSATPTPTFRAPHDAASAAIPRAVTLRAQLQARLDKDRRRLGLPGVSATIFFRDGSSWTGTSGLADVEAGTPVTTDTAFAVGSVSKTYTAALIVGLAGDGRIDLAAPAAAYLPEARLDRRITVRMLLDHTSGLDDFFLHPPIDKALLAHRDAAWTTARSLGYVGKRYFVPGKGWHYSNTNYLYLGMIAERVTGTSLAAALRARFFTPLGLRATWYQAVEGPRTALAHGYRFSNAKPTATPIDLADGTGVAPFRSVVTAAGGAGSIAATSGDVARWARLLYGGTALGAVGTAVMIDDIATTAGYRPNVPYGLGVQVFPIDGRLSIGHSGRLLGFRAAARHIPSEATTIAVLTNQSRADPAVVVAHLLAIVFGPEPFCPLCSRPT